MSSVNSYINQINSVSSPRNSIYNYNSPKSNRKNSNYNNSDTTSSDKFIERNQDNCTYPFCNCYKCKMNIQKDYQMKKNKNNLSYNNNTTDSSTNQNSLITNSNRKKGNISLLDNCFKEHLKSGLQSVMKRDFKNMQLETNESFVPKDNTNSKGSPFIGRTTNSIMYPEFLISPKRKKPYISEDLLKIPFSGNSSYKENYEKFDDRYYKEKILPFLKKDNLETIGKLITETTTKETYKNYNTDESSKSPLIIQKNKISFKDKNSFSNLGIAPPNIKDNYMSQYRRSYIFDKDNQIK